MSQKVTVTVEPGEGDAEDKVTTGRLLARGCVWLLLLAVGVMFLMFAMTGEMPLALFTGGETSIPSGTGGLQSTEGDTTLIPTTVPGTDGNPVAQPTAVVVFTAIPQPTATPWVYPAPTEPAAPTQPPSPVESACPHIDGEVIWVEIHGSGLAPNCFTIYSWQRIGLASLLSDSVLITLEDSSLQLAPGARSEFSEPVGNLLTPGVHKLRADPYGSVDVWLEVR